MGVPSHDHSLEQGGSQRHGHFQRGSSGTLRWVCVGDDIVLLGMVSWGVKWGMCISCISIS